MIKWLVILTLTIFSTNLWATPINMACVTEVPSSSFVAYTEGSDITFNFIHHNGVEYMPIWNNIITPHDLSMLGVTAKTLTGLGKFWQFQMPEKNCEIIDGMMISCFGSLPPINMNGHQVSLWAVYTVENVEKSFAGEYASVYTTLGLSVDGKTYYVPMKYWDYECERLLSAKNLKSRFKSKNLFLK